MSAATRSDERMPAVLTDRPDTGTNQRRIDEAFRLLGIAAERVASSRGRTAFVLDMASHEGVLQEVWCRDEPSHASLDVPAGIESGVISGDLFGPVNAERYVLLQKALSALLLELTRPDFTGAASLHLRGWAGEISEEIRGESRRQWHF